MKPKKHGAKYQITYRCPNYPKIINESFDSEEEAYLRIAQINLEKKRGTLMPPAYLIDPEKNHDLYRETITVAQLMSEYVSLYGLAHWSEGTLSCNQHRINDYIIPYIGDVPIKTLTTHKLEQFYRKLHTEPAVKLKGREHEVRTISYSVIEKVHALIRSALNQAIRWDYLRGGNPAMAVELPRQKTRPRDVWSAQEARYALEVCADPVLRLCMYLALGCSMRIGEILGLTWDCVHIEDDLIRAGKAYLRVEKELRRSSKQCIQDLSKEGRDDIFFTFPACKAAKSTTVLVLKTPKTESSVRTIYIPNSVAVILKAAKERQQSIQADLDSEYQDFNIVVAQNNGRPFEERIIAQKMRDMIAEHNLRPVVFHSLRHSSTSLKLRISGGDIKAVQGDTGHAQANMVTDVYSHIMNDDRVKLAQDVDSQFFVQPAPSVEPPPAADESVEKLTKLIQASPDMAKVLLQMSQILGANASPT